MVRLLFVFNAGVTGFIRIFSKTNFYYCECCECGEIVVCIGNIPHLAKL